MENQSGLRTRFVDRNRSPKRPNQSGLTRPIHFRFRLGALLDQREKGAVRLDNRDGTIVGAEGDEAIVARCGAGGDVDGDEAGFGIALLPESSIAEERAAKSLAVIRVGDLDAANPVTAIVRKGGYLSPASRKLLEILKADYRA
ncbi:MAG: LysR substrate-binding domain-containing protein [Parvibaculum sp.]|uniref:LysR substrate-binding domain-containing protein n=1 Tax=Parvibaculum sp. TaxID=2024848 RepID=UPI00271CA586|nr:LysR substrate-binding domain-containing protein [Parvibaculum sp.]MDO8840590.1 LysR substrate-binding domain-containing protein [Parvibaculum sp.]